MHKRRVAYLHIKFQLVSKPEDLHHDTNNTPVYIAVGAQLYRNTTSGRCVTMEYLLLL